MSEPVEGTPRPVRRRCSWCTRDELYVSYHDFEWGVPLYGDAALFELLTLEGAQAGLSWLTVLRRREGYRRHFANFDPALVARFDDARISAILGNTDVIRHRRKIESVITNARAIVALRREFGSFEEYVWRIASSGDDAANAGSVMSKRLAADGFTFVGPTICRSFIEASGMRNAHEETCFRFAEIEERRVLESTHRAIYPESRSGRAPLGGSVTNVQTLYEAAGGGEGLRRLAGAWHARVVSDEVVGHAFSHGFHPQHTTRLAAYWAEALGGPAAYSTTTGDESHVVRLHSGNGPHEEMDRRAIACFDEALVDVGLSHRDDVGRSLHDYFEWATTTAMTQYPDRASDVPENLPIPHWSWDGLVEGSPHDEESS